MTNKECSRLIADTFNLLTREQMIAVPCDTRQKVASFLRENGYRFVFGRWYLQENPLNEGERDE